MFKTISHKKIYQNRWLTFYADSISFPNGAKGVYGYVERNSGVSIAVLDKNYSILLIEQYRYPTKKCHIEIPAGSIIKGETPEQACLRELAEEAGIYEIEELEFLQTYYPLSAHSTETQSLFMARVQRFSEFKGTEFDEDIQSYLVTPIDKALKMIDIGKIDDAITSNAIQLVHRKLNKK